MAPAYMLRPIKCSTAAMVISEKGITSDSKWWKHPPLAGYVSDYVKLTW